MTSSRIYSIPGPAWSRIMLRHTWVLHVALLAIAFVPIMESLKGWGPATWGLAGVMLIICVRFVWPSMKEATEVRIDGNREVSFVLPLWTETLDVQSIRAIRFGRLHRLVIDHEHGWVSVSRAIGSFDDLIAELQRLNPALEAPPPVHRVPLGRSVLRLAIFMGLLFLLPTIMKLIFG